MYVCMCCCAAGVLFWRVVDLVCCSVGVVLVCWFVVLVCVRVW